MQFRSLRVMNEDCVAPGQGFGSHPHHDMEIVTYVLEGELEHHDSMGNGEVLRPGEFQRMSPARAFRTASSTRRPTEPVHLYQIWLFPRERPDAELRAAVVSSEEKHNRLRLVASHDGRDDSLTIHQDADIYLGDLADGKDVSHELQPGRHAWLQVLRGTVRVGDGMADTELTAGDAAAISEETAVSHRAIHAEVMLFDLN